MYTQVSQDTTREAATHEAIDILRVASYQLLLELGLTALGSHAYAILMHARDHLEGIEPA